MSPLYLHKNKLLIAEDGSLAVNKSCCCSSSSSSSMSSLSSDSSLSSLSSDGSFSSMSSEDIECADCYKMDYIITLTMSCDSASETITGSLLLNQYGIACYNDNKVVSATNDILDYGELCGVGGTSFEIYCSNLNTVIIISTPSDFFVDSVPTNLCCSPDGSYELNSNDNAISVSITMSLANEGSCVCEGYTVI